MLLSRYFVRYADGTKEKKVCHGDGHTNKRAVPLRPCAIRARGNEKSAKIVCIHNSSRQNWQIANIHQAG